MYTLDSIFILKFQNLFELNRFNISTFVPFPLLLQRTNPNQKNIGKYSTASSELLLIRGKILKIYILYNLANLLNFEGVFLRNCNSKHTKYQFVELLKYFELYFLVMFNNDNNIIRVIL